MFDVEFDKAALRFLKKTHAILAGRITEKAENLRIQPIPPDAKRLQGQSNIWRIRVGDYRILYYINYAQKKITIARIDHRSRVYEF